MDISRHVIAVPFHDGLLEVDRGQGPGALLAAAGISAAETIASPDPAAPEAARIFTVARSLADRVRGVRAGGRFPLVLAGDCNSSLGTVAGCGTDGLGVVWFDAHPDFDTPDDSPSGSLDAMALALLVGRGWDTLRGTVPGLTPINEENIVLLGVREFEPGQRERLARSQVHVLHGGAWPDARASEVLDDLEEHVARVYLHIDLDALDSSEGIANRYSAPGGLSADQLLQTIALVADRFEVAAAAVTAYDPAADTDGRMAGAATRVLASLAARR
jgi:arginase